MVAVTLAVGEDGWDDLEVVRGSILQVFLDETDLTFSTPGLIATFLVLSVSVSPDRTRIIEAKSLGAGDSAVDAELSSKFNRKRGCLHLCGSKPCTESEIEVVMHVTKVRLWKVPWNEASCLKAQQRRAVKAFLGIQEDGDVEKDPAKEKETQKEKDPKALKRPAGRFLTAAARKAAAKAKDKKEKSTKDLKAERQNQVQRWFQPKPATT